MKFCTFEIIVEKEPEDEGYLAYSPTLPVCFSNGRTVEEVRRNIREAVQQHIESLLAHGLRVSQNENLAHVEELTVGVDDPYAPGHGLSLPSTPGAGGRIHGLVERPCRKSTQERRHYESLEKPGLGEAVDQEVRGRVMRALSTGRFQLLHRKHEWLELQRRWRRQEADTVALAAELDQIEVWWGLYSDSSFGPIGALRAI